MMDDLFNADFAWGDVSQPAATLVATPIAGGGRPREPAASPPPSEVSQVSQVSQVVWVDATPLSDPAAVECDGAVSQADVAAAATLDATPEIVARRPLSPSVPATVAAVASVADWRAGLAALASLPAPPFLAPADWRLIQADAQALGRTWASELFDLGWSVNEVFGWTPRPWCSAVEPAGLVRFLGGQPVDAVDGNEATIVQRDGGRLTYRRCDRACSQPFDRSAAVPLWVAFSPENLPW